MDINSRGNKNFLEPDSSGGLGEGWAEAREDSGVEKRRGWREIKESDPTPFEAETLERVCRELVALPPIGVPYKPKPKGRGLKENGESYEQVKEYLIPVIINMYQKGYNRAMVVEKIAQKLNVGKSNRFVRKLVYDGHNEYLQKHLYEKEKQ